MEIIQPKPPLVVTVIAAFQLVLGAYLFYFLVIAWIDLGNLALLDHAIDRVWGFRTQPRSPGETLGEIKIDRIFSSFLAVLSLKFLLISGWGLLKLKPWARHSVAGEYGLFTFLGVRALFFFTAVKGASRLSQDAMQPVYLRIFLSGMICLTLLLYGGVAEAFGEPD